ncbi:MAG TPA: zf-HC2 domain-containing protein [Gemmatimonadales bacterium]|nr:zf-HC2 domain-containing protein [Gemmatimonadales bacterium]
MPHVDEGTLHALLDGELEPAEVQQVQTHFATCPACQSRLDEARQMMEETERLLRALEPQAAASSGPRSRAPRAEPPGAVPPPPPPSYEEQVKAALDPMVLIPDNPLASEVRRRRLRTAAWAAGLLVAFGAGGFAVKSGMLSDKPTGELHVRPEDFQPVSTPNPQEVRAAAPPPAAAVPTAAPGGAEPAPAPPAPSPSAPAPTPLAAAQPVDSAKGTAPAPGGDQPAPPAQAPAPAPTPPQVAANSAPAPDSDVTPSDAAATSAARQDQAPTAQAKVARDSRPQETRSRTSSQGANDAMRALDRQKAADASRRALAAIDAERRARQQQAELSREAANSRGDTSAGGAPARTESAAPPPAPPQPPTLEQRAQITSRIGLDEATRLLGGPLHAIDAADYTRQFVGIVSGASVPGADPTRPVVRAVYIDRSGRVLYLDQQRVRPGQAQDLPTSAPEGGGDHRWVIGGTLLRLTGERTSAALDSLARRVR